MLSAIFDEREHIAITPMCIEPVDARGDELVFPVDVVQSRNNRVARFLLVGGCHGVFEIEANDIGLARCRFFEQRRARTGYKQFRTVKPRRRPPRHIPETQTGVPLQTARQRCFNPEAASTVPAAQSSGAAQDALGTERFARLPACEAGHIFAALPRETSVVPSA